MTFRRGIKSALALTFSLIYLMAAASWAAADILYGATGAGGVAGDLLILNPTNGSVITNVGQLRDAQGNAYGLTGLAYQSSTGFLFGSTNNNSPTNPGHLVR